MSTVVAAGKLGIRMSTLYRWIHDGFVPAVLPDVDGEPIQIRMTNALYAKVTEMPPVNNVPVAEAASRLRMSCQSLWQYVANGMLQACQVTKGRNRGLHILMFGDRPPTSPGLFNENEPP